MFTRWWIIISLVTFGLVLAWMTGLIYTINKADITKLSFVILGIFFMYSVRTGMVTWHLRNDHPWGRREKEFLESAKFVSRVLIDLGMIGTVVGFIYMLSISFRGIETATAASFKYALQSMGTGMGTALWTTATGLICSVLLRVQLHPLDLLIGGRHEHSGIS